MNCDFPQDCPAKNRPDKPCWEIAGELNDYRVAMDICRDCIVFMLKVAKHPVLSRSVMQAIMDYRAISNAVTKRIDSSCGLLLPMK
jgi:hypothetical protein